MKRFIYSMFAALGFLAMVFGFTVDISGKGWWIPSVVCCIGTLSVYFSLAKLGKKEKTSVKYDKRYIYIDGVRIPRYQSEFDSILEPYRKGSDNAYENLLNLIEKDGDESNEN